MHNITTSLEPSLTYTIPIPTMIFTNAISLVLALAPATLFAAPTQPADSIANLIARQDLPKPVMDMLVKTNGLCDLSNVALPVGMFYSSLFLWTTILKSS